MDKYPAKSAIISSSAAQVHSSEEEALHSCIAEIEQLRAELRISREREEEARSKYSELYDFAPSGYVTLSPDHRILELNQSGSNIIGKDTRELIGINFDTFISDSTRQALRMFYRNISQSHTKEFCEAVIETDGNRQKNVFIEGKVVGKGNELLLNIIDITSLEQSALLLQQTRQNYETIFNTAEELLFVSDREGKVLYTNQRARSLLGYTDSEFHTLTFEKMHPSSERTEVIHYFNSILKGEEGTCTIPVITKSGMEIPAETRLWNGEWNGKPAIFGLCKDITTQKLAEHTLQINEKKYRMMLNASPDGILLIDLAGVINEISAIGLEMFGFESRVEILGRHISDFVAEEEHYLISEIIGKTIDEGLIQNLEVVFKRRDNSLFHGDLSSTLIQGPDGSPQSFMIIVRDITQRKKAAAKQMHADRMANLGEMASGIAHEINQPLNIISMVLDMVLLDATKRQKVDVAFLKEKSERIFENITRIRNIIDHIRAFSRNHDDYVFSNFNINGSIEKAVSMITEQFKHLGIKLSLNLGTDLPPIYGNTFKFEQVIVNLLVNSKDALLEKKNGRKDYTDMNIVISSAQYGNDVIVEVSDNGIGIKDDDIGNVILPFYTTKDEGKGTGLGLSICYQIIKEMNGTIDIKSSRTTGTKITISIDLKKVSMG